MKNMPTADVLRDAWEAAMKVLRKLSVATRGERASWPTVRKLWKDKRAELLPAMEAIAKVLLKGRRTFSVRRYQMNCPMCGVSLDNTAAPAHSCQINLGPATFTPSHPTYPMRCKDCGGRFDSTKHQMTCVAPTLIDHRDAEITRLNLQVEAMRKVVEAAKAIDDTYIDWKKIGLAGVQMLDALTEYGVMELRRSDKRVEEPQKHGCPLCNKTGEPMCAGPSGCYCGCHAWKRKCACQDCGKELTPSERNPDPNLCLDCCRKRWPDSPNCPLPHE